MNSTHQRLTRLEDHARDHARRAHWIERTATAITALIQQADHDPQARARLARINAILDRARARRDQGLQTPILISETRGTNGRKM